MSHLDRFKLKCFHGHYISLNPCCNGCRTWTAMSNLITARLKSVLILVVMDVALGQVFSQTLRNQQNMYLNSKIQTCFLTDLTLTLSQS